ncbi:MAG: hypothetical protein BWY75_01244 [bacterium ADurb.Bin425]|nr:MAG: hypothetical protein BWY75_01244 [bacterium ADurb.Bin425]
MGQGVVQLCLSQDAGFYEQFAEFISAVAALVEIDREFLQGFIEADIFAMKSAQGIYCNLGAQNAVFEKRLALHRGLQIVFRHKARHDDDTTDRQSLALGDQHGLSQFFCFQEPGAREQITQPQGLILGGGISCRGAFCHLAPKIFSIDSNNYLPRTNEGLSPFLFS